jgi:hypothetical protein
MLKDLFQYLYEQIRAGDNPTPHIERLSQGEQAVTLKGVRTIESIPVPLIHRSLHSLEDLVTMVSQFGGDLSTIFVGPKGIECVLDNDDLQETVSLDFVNSVQYDTLPILQRGLPQRDLIRSLRTVFAGCFDDSLALNFAEIQFKLLRQSDNSVTATGGESMGRAVNKEISMPDIAIPETVTARLPLYTLPADIDTRIDVSFAVEFDFDAERIALIPMGDQIMRQKQIVLNNIKDRLLESVGEGVNVVCGHFNLIT